MTANITLLQADDQPDAAEVYRFYAEHVKPVYSWIEARKNSLPIGLLAKIQDAFNELRGVYSDGSDADEGFAKAISALKQGAIEAHHQEFDIVRGECERFCKQAHTKGIDTGSFDQKLRELRNKATDDAADALRLEEAGEVHQAFAKWQEVSATLKQIREDYLTRLGEGKWEKTFRQKLMSMGDLRAIIWTLVFSLVVWILKTIWPVLVDALSG